MDEAQATGTVTPSDTTRPVRHSGLAARSWPTVLWTCVAVLAGVLAGIASARRDWPGVALFAALAGLAVWCSGAGERANRRSAASAAAVAEWPLHRVGQLLAQGSTQSSGTGSADQVKRLRDADPRLSLTDAAALVGAATAPAQDRGRRAEDVSYD